MDEHELPLDVVGWGDDDEHRSAWSRGLLSPDRHPRRPLPGNLLQVAATVVGVALLTAYAGFHAGVDSERARATARTASASASAPGSPTAPSGVAAGPARVALPLGPDTAAQVVQAWTAGRRALLVGDLVDYCEHYAGLGSGTMYADLAACEHDELRTVGAAQADPAWALQSARQVADAQRVELRADSVAVVWDRDLLLPSGEPVPQDGTDAFWTLRLLPGQGWRLVGHGTVHPFQVVGYDGPGLPR